MTRDSTAAFAAFYRTEHERLLRFFRRRVGRDEAPDLVQETFARLLRSGAFERMENPQAYLTRSARNLLIDRARRDKQSQGVVFPFDEGCDAHVCPEQTWRIEEADMRRAYGRALRTMSRRTRRVFMMHRMRRMTYTEIAKHLGIGDKRVQHHMNLALVRLRRALTAWSVAG
ncbi:RNA polymerase sigma factor [Sphingosinicella soli]|uniref:RNA polymerase sigma-70 factor (ECF subfamily) n=1 Tax=Sphingosinicella soli TaxID=333708 RepID=A0A7W7B433_9SPHN|nr:sigma-70 family RNA polymerase sigma factor [Sphingosinicella soli]MBB4633595.1 RNA polymerase sigma-70 factor (ECF subfamily) [Sphingosinicella soli]